MKAAYIVKYGPSERAFEIRTLATPTPEKGEVLIEVSAFGLNYADVMTRLGQYRDAPAIPCVPGYEAAGKIMACGEGVSDLKPGDEVLAFTRFGAYATHAIADCRAVVKRPDGLDAATATALGTQYCTALYCASEAAVVHPGDIVLIHAAAGGVGTALVQWCLHRRAIIAGVCSGEEKTEYLKSLGVQHPVNRQSIDFYDYIKANKDLGQVDVVFDPVGGRTFRKSRKLLGAGGRIVNYGIAERSGSKGGMLATIGLLWRYGIVHPIGLLANSKVMAGVNMLRIADHKPEYLQHILHGVMAYYEKGVFQPKVKTYSVTDLAKAHTLVEKGATTAKIAIEW